jgi:hypothetical protein
VFYFQVSRQVVLSFRLVATYRTDKFGLDATLELNVAAKDMFVFVTPRTSAALVGPFAGASRRVFFDAQQISYILLGAFLFYKRNRC